MQHITVRVSRDQPAYMMLRTHSENVFSPVFFLLLPANLPNADHEQAGRQTLGSYPRPQWLSIQNQRHCRQPSHLQCSNLAMKQSGNVTIWQCSNVAIWQCSNVAIRIVVVRGSSAPSAGNSSYLQSLRTMGG